MNRIFRYTVSVAIAVMALAPVAFAIEYKGVGGRPANPVEGNPRTESIFVYTLDSGDKKTDAVKVFNSTDSRRTINLDAVDSVISSGGAFACAQSAEKKKDVGAWTKLSKTTVVLDAGDSIEVPFTISVPENVAVGEHGGCITIQDKTRAQESNDQGGVILGFRSGIRMAVMVPGDIVKSLNIDSLTIDGRKDDKYLVVPTVTNDGNVSLDADVEVSIDTLFGTKVGEGISSTYPVLQRSSASWNLELQRPFWGGFYQASAVVTYNSNPTATLGSNMGESETKELRSEVFFAPPTALAAFIEIILIAAIAFVAVWYLRRQRDIEHIRANWVDYSVKKNDTLTEIAKVHHTSWRRLARVNKVKAPYTLVKGHKLKVPPLPKE